MKNWILCMALLLMLTQTACSESVPADTQAETPIPQSETTEREDVSAHDEPALTPAETRVKITMNVTVVYGTINNNVTAQAFLQQLPFHITGYRAASDICCAVSDELPFDPALQEAWNIGEIGWFRGWFTIVSLFLIIFPTSPFPFAARSPGSLSRYQGDNGSDDRFLRRLARQFYRKPSRRVSHCIGMFYSNSSRMIFSCFPDSLGSVLLKVKS